MSRTRRALAAAIIAAAVPVAASAALVWTLVAAPLTTTANQSTTFILTATDLDPLNELGCLEVDLPASFVIESVGAPLASNGETWVATVSDGAVVVHSLDGGGRLELSEWVSFTIQARASAAGSFLWPNHAHRQQDCSDTAETGVPLTVTVLPALTSTPTPIPTATASPTSILPLPSTSPSASPTSSSGASPAERSTPTPQLGSTATGGDGDGASTVRALHIARSPDDGGAGTEVGVELLGLLDGGYAWFVPAAPVAVPGLVVILWVILQAIGGLAWIPAVRRMADESDARRRRTTASG